MNSADPELKAMAQEVGIVKYRQDKVEKAIESLAKSFESLTRIEERQIAADERERAILERVSKHGKWMGRAEPRLSVVEDRVKWHGIAILIVATPVAAGLVGGLFMLMKG